VTDDRPTDAEPAATTDAEPYAPPAVRILPDLTTGGIIGLDDGVSGFDELGGSI
jgi:hypothetical protein